VEPYHLYQRLSHPFTTVYRTEDLVQVAGEQLQARVTSEEERLPHVEYEVRVGKPFVELILAGRAWLADLLVVGGTARGEGWFLSGASELVLRKAQVPVLVLKQPLAPGPKRVLAPTDFSACAKKAAEEAHVLVQHFSGRLSFFHALKSATAYAASYGLAGTDFTPPAPLLTPVDLEAEWEHFLSDLPWLAHIEWDTTTKEGPPVALIAEEADRQGADLIVMGTHGRTGAPHMLLGSVAEGVVRSVSCPVLTIRPDAFQFELP
jgi:nucleotide-binding universal stress UspA family protein